MLAYPALQIDDTQIVETSRIRAVRMRLSLSAAAPGAAAKSAAFLSLLLIAATPISIGFSYRITTILVALAALPALYALVRGEVALLPCAAWGRFFLAAGVAVLAWAGLSASWSPDPLGALGTTAKVAGVLFAGYLSGRLSADAGPVLSSRWRGRLFWTTIVPMAILILIVAIVPIYWGGPNDNRVQLPFIGQRLVSWFNQPAAFFALWSWVVAIAIWPLSRLRAAMIMVGAIALSAATGYIVGLVAIAAGLAAWLLSHVLRSAAPWILAGALVVGTFAMPFVAAEFPSYEEIVAKPSDRNPSEMHRLMIWRFTSDHIFQNPYLGWGMDGARHVPGGDERVSLTLAGEPKRLEKLPLHPHDTVLQLWLELGVIGAALYALIGAALYVCLSRLALSALDRGLLTGAVSAAHVMMGASFSIWSNWWLATMAIVAVLGLSVYSRRGDSAMESMKKAG